MKKILAFILLFSLSFAMVSCGGDDDEYEWRGDWNDPNDKNYKPEYNGQYNPIEGMWKGGTSGFYFSKDFKVHNVEYKSDGSYQVELFKGLYSINDEAFLLKVNIDSESGIKRYKLNAAKDTLYITSKLLTDGDWATYSRFVPKEETPE